MNLEQRLKDLGVNDKEVQEIIKHLDKGTKIVVSGGICTGKGTLVKNINKEYPKMIEQVIQDKIEEVKTEFKRNQQEDIFIIHCEYKKENGLRFVYKVDLIEKPEGKLTQNNFSINIEKKKCYYLTEDVKLEEASQKELLKIKNLIDELIL